MYIANLGMKYGEVLKMLEVAKACNAGDEDPTELDTIVGTAKTDPARNNRIGMILVVYPDYRYMGGEESDMAPDMD